MIFWIIICHVILLVNSSPFFNWALSSTTKAYDWGAENGKSFTNSGDHYTADQLASPTDGFIEATTQGTNSEYRSDDSKEIIDVFKQLVDQTEDCAFDQKNCQDVEETTKPNTQTTEFTYFKRWFPEPPTKSLKTCTDKNSGSSSTCSCTTETSTETSTSNTTCFDAGDPNQKFFRIDSMDKHVEDRTPKMKVYNCSKSNDSFREIINPEFKLLAMEEKFHVTTPRNKSIFIQEVISSPVSAEIHTNKNKENYVSGMPLLYSSTYRNEGYESVATSSQNPGFTLVSSPRSYMFFNFAFTKTLDNNNFKDTTRDLRTVNKIASTVGAIPLSYTDSIYLTEPIISTLPLVNTERHLKSLVAKHKNTNCVPHHKSTTETCHTSEATCKTTKDACELVVAVCCEHTTATSTCDIKSETRCKTTEETTCMTSEATTETTCPTTQETTCETTCPTICPTTCPTTCKCKTTSCKPVMTEQCQKTSIQMTTTQPENGQKQATDVDKSTIPTTKRVYGGELNVKFKYP